MEKNPKSKLTNPMEWSKARLEWGKEYAKYMSRGFKGKEILKELAKCL